MGGISPKYRKMMSDLDSKGVMTSIDRVSRCQFTFLQNGEAVKTYKKRDSANKYLKRLWDKHMNLKSTLDTSRT